MVPAADVGKRHLHSEIGFNQLSNLEQTIAKAAARVIDARRGLVFFRIGRAQHLHGFKGFIAAAVQHRVHGLLVHGFKGVARDLSAGSARAHSEAAYIAHGDGGSRTGQRARQCTPPWPQREKEICPDHSLRPTRD